jgi:hypothetical protein
MSPSAWRCPKKRNQKNLMKPLAYKKNEMALRHAETKKEKNFAVLQLFKHFHGVPF